MNHQARQQAFFNRYGNIDGDIYARNLRPLKDEPCVSALINYSDESEGSAGFII